MGLATTNNVRRHAKSIISHEDELLVLVESAEPLLLRHAFIVLLPSNRPTVRRHAQAENSPPHFQPLALRAARRSARLVA